MTPGSVLERTSQFFATLRARVNRSMLAREGREREMTEIDKYAGERRERQIAHLREMIKLRQICWREER